MICPICEKEFEPVKRLGGQNRQICYECLPDNLDKLSREKIKTHLFKAKANREKVEKGCSICGYNSCAGALEWHHEGDDKKFNPSDRLRDGTVKAYNDYKEEIKKCILVCANCHRELHYSYEEEE